ncbi:MAG TPA: pyrrolo-quinoline quinone [Bacteroides sp.]|nr:pyrrolo-quinoline quinone [Bacteroides sp.]
MENNKCFWAPRPVALFALAAVITSCADNWNQFRGPDQDMVVRVKKLPAEWGEGNNVAWTYDIEGEGWSSPVVWGHRVFITADIPEEITPRPEQRAGQPAGPPQDDRGFMQDIYRWEVICLDLITGKEIWKKVARRGNPRVSKNPATTYASETPVTDGKRLYAYFGMHGLFCYDMDGKLLWEKDLGAFETQNGWGTGSSPVLHKGVLYVQVDNEEQSFLVALDAATGDEKWRSDRREKTSYSTPFIWENSMRTELVTGGETARSYDPETGKILWELFMAGRYSIPSPVADKEYLYLGNAGFRNIPGTLFAVKAGAEGDLTPGEGSEAGPGILWFNLDAPTGNPSPLLYDGLLYMLSSRGGEVSCIDPATGAFVYREKVEDAGACWASPWAHDGKIYFYDEKGMTSVLQAGKEFEVLARYSLDDRFWASVAATPDAYIFRGVERLYCIRE